MSWEVAGNIQGPQGQRGVKWYIDDGVPGLEWFPEDFQVGDYAVDRRNRYRVYERKQGAWVTTLLFLEGQEGPQGPQGPPGQDAPVDTYLPLTGGTLTGPLTVEGQTTVEGGVVAVTDSARRLRTIAEIRRELDFRDPGWIVIWLPDSNNAAMVSAEIRVFHFAYDVRLVVQGYFSSSGAAWYSDWGCSIDQRVPDSAWDDIEVALIREANGSGRRGIAIGRTGDTFETGRSSNNIYATIRTGYVATAPSWDNIANYTVERADDLSAYYVQYTKTADRVLYESSGPYSPLSHSHSEYLPLSGGTITGPLSVQNTLNVANPTVPTAVMSMKWNSDLGFWQFRPGGGGEGSSSGLAWTYYDDLLLTASNSGINGYRDANFNGNDVTAGYFTSDNGATFLGDVHGTNVYLSGVPNHPDSATTKDYVDSKFAPGRKQNIGEFLGSVDHAIITPAAEGWGSFFVGIDNILTAWAGDVRSSDANGNAYLEVTTTGTATFISSYPATLIEPNLVFSTLDPGATPAGSTVTITITRGAAGVGMPTYANAYYAAFAKLRGAYSDVPVTVEILNNRDEWVPGDVVAYSQVPGLRIGPRIRLGDGTPNPYPPKGIRATFDLSNRPAGSSGRVYLEMLGIYHSKQPFGESVFVHLFGDESIYGVKTFKGNVNVEGLLSKNGTDVSLEGHTHSGGITEGDEEPPGLGAGELWWDTDDNAPPVVFEGPVQPPELPVGGLWWDTSE